MKKLVDIITDFAIEAGKNKVTEFKEKQQIRSAVGSYIKSQQKYNEICSLSEEFDFQGLIEYIEGTLMTEVEAWLYSISAKERGAARKLIIASAVSYTNAETDDAKKRVTRITSNTLDIIKTCSKKRIPKTYRLITAEVVDEFEEQITPLIEGKDEIVDAIQQLQDTIEQQQSNSPMSIDKAVNLAKNQEWTILEDTVGNFVRHISPEHPLAPDYGVDYENGSFKSVPLSNEAVRKYPPRIELLVDLYSDGKKVSGSIDSVIDYHKRHQLPLEADVRDAVKYLGEEKDPFQNEALRAKGSKFTMYPPALSASRACSIKIKDKTYFGLVNIKLQEILDDNTYVYGNKEDPDSTINFEIRINEANPEHPQFTVKTRKLNNHEYLRLATFYRDLDKYKDLHIYDLQTGEDIIAGRIDFEMKSDFGSMDEEVNFINRVCDIEDFFKISLSPPKEVTPRDLSLITHISNMIRETNVNCPWSELNFTFTLDSRMRSFLKNCNGRMEYLYYLKDDSVKVLGKTLSLRYIRYIEKASIKNYEKVLKKLEVLDDGDDLKITIVADAPDTILDSFSIPEELEYQLQ